MILTLLIQHCNEIEETFWDKNLITIVGLGLGLLFFIVERVLNYIREVREANHNWFLNIILSPQLEEINKFYNKTNEDLKIALEDLLSKFDDLSHSDFLSLQRSKIDTFKETRRNYFNNFSSMVRSYDPILANSFDRGVNELDDIYTEVLDKPKSIDDFNDITSKIFSNKSKIISLLFNVVRRKNWFLSLFSSR